MNKTPIAYDAYQQLAEHYSAKIETKPHNAFYERPAMISLWPEMSGLDVLDAGCGPGIYAELLHSRGARVVACDMSDRMLELAGERLGDKVELRKLDLSRPLDAFDGSRFDFVNAPLCLDYVEDWKSVFREFHRITRPGGYVQFSCGHPAFDANYFKTSQYFGVEAVECTWTGFGIEVAMPSFRRSLEEVLSPVLEAGFCLTHVHEPMPTEEFRLADPMRYLRLMHRPAFLCVQARKRVGT